MDSPNLYEKLTDICKAITRGEYEQAKAVFDLPLDQQEDKVAILAEALGMMLVRTEAREFELGRAIEELTATREDLLWHKKQLAQENSRLRAELRRKYPGTRPVAAAPAMQLLLRQAERAARVDATLLITGETGTGKGVFARHIHAMSLRADKPFIPINCAAIPGALLESELFGIEAGVASGVQARIGRFEQASGGTVLLDEIGDMPLESQAKLLHVIETGMVERVGGRKPISVGVRIMAATHRDLEKSVAEGSFRADLFYRLNVMRLHIPPLRERKEDIPLLARLFLSRLAVRLPMAASGLSRGALARLMGHPWPGNVRELENELERAALLAENAAITAGDLSPALEATTVDDSNAETSPPAVPGLYAAATTHETNNDALPTLAEMEFRHIAAVLDRMGGNKSRAAKALGISREGLRVKLKEMDAPHRK